MDVAMGFAVLGIEETKEETKIRQAYYEKLAENNPEDNPEGFRRLREAYEQVMDYIKMPEEEEEEKEDFTPVGRWMKRVEEVYFCLPKRLSREAWREVFQDEVCIDLDYGEEAKWKLFQFLSEYYRLTSDIYRFLDEVFGFQEGEREFKEHLPAAFVDYMIHKVQDMEGMDDFLYQGLEGADTADYDQFFSRLYELEELVGEKKVEEAKQTITVMESLGINHPYYRMEKMRLAVLEGRKDVTQEAQELIEAYQDNARIQLLSAEVLWKCDKKEEAAAVFSKAGEKFGSLYLSEKYLALFEKEKGNLSDAIFHCQQALQNSDDEMLEEMLKELDEIYIEKCKEDFLEGTLEAEEMRRVCRSYIRLERAQEGIDFLLGYPEYQKKIRNIHNVLSALYFHADRYQESLEECKLWRTEVEQRIAEGNLKEGEEENADEAELAVTYSCEGQTLRILAENLEKRKDIAIGYKKAEQAFLKALSYEKDSLRLKQDLLDLLIAEGEFERAVDLADEMLDQNREWFPALVQKQRACYELDRPQEVIDLFREAREIYSKHAPIYELAARVFIDYDQYENAKGILGQAKEEELKSFGLELAEIYLDRVQCETKREFEQLLKREKKLVNKFQKDAKKRELAELYYEMAIAEDCRVDGYSKKAIEYMRKAIRLRKSEPLRVSAYYYYTYARVLQNGQKYEEAVKNYEIYRRNSEMSERLAVNMARCYYELEKWEKAIYFYQEALSENPKQQEANRKIAAIYRWVGVNWHNMPILKKALYYAQQQVEVCPDSAYDYRAKGNILRLIGDLEGAMEDAKKSLKLEKNNPYGLMLKGRILYYEGKYQPSLACIEKAISRLSSPKYDGHDMYAFAARCCRKMGDYARAEKWYKDGIALFEGEDQEDFYWKLIGFYEEHNRLEEAFYLLFEAYRKDLITEEDYVNYGIEIRRALCSNIGRAEQLEREAYQAVKQFDSIDVWETWGDLQFFYLGNKEKALQIKQKVMERVEEEQAQWENSTKYLERMHIYWEMGDKEEVKKWGDRYINMILDHYSIETGSFPLTKKHLKSLSLENISEWDQHYNHPENGYRNLCMMVRFWIFRGYMDLAESGLERLKGMKMCRHCWEQECEDWIETLAIYYEAIGELEKAYQCWHRNWKKEPKDEMYYYKTKKLGEKLGHQMDWNEQDEGLWNRLNSMKR